VTLPTPDAQSPKPLSSQARPAFAAHSIPTGFSAPSTPALTSTSASAFPLAETASASPGAGSRVSAATDFSHPWDLATGGFKTLTAKRELPPPQQRRGSAAPPSEPVPARSYMFLLVILACIVAMLISGGVVLFMTLQP
jgi:hypothetical protein